VTDAATEEHGGNSVPVPLFLPQISCRLV